MSAQKKKRLPDIVDKLRERAIAEKFIDENSKKFKTIMEFAEHSTKTHKEDVVIIYCAMVGALKLKSKDKDHFLIGYILGYEYGKYRTEALNALNRSNIQK